MLVDIFGDDILEFRVVRPYEDAIGAVILAEDTTEGLNKGRRNGCVGTVNAKVHV